MARIGRVKSPSSIYHVMIRGVNRQEIFFEREDYSFFLDALKLLTEEMNFDVYAYCLMSNHVHLLIKENGLGIAALMRRLNVKYAMWFNKKYDRVGHLLQDRFKSEPIDSQSYFFTVLRYIHYNPVKANISRKPEGYPYSSYKNYFRNDIISSDFALSLLGEDGFFELHREITDSDEIIMDIDNQRKIIEDDEVAAIMQEICSCSRPGEFFELSKEKQEEAIREMRHRGVKMRQISNATGVSKYMIRKIVGR